MGVSISAYLGERGVGKFNRGLRNQSLGVGSLNLACQMKGGGVGGVGGLGGLGGGISISSLLGQGVSNLGGGKPQSCLSDIRRGGGGKEEGNYQSHLTWVGEYEIWVGG